MEATNQPAYDFKANSLAHTPTRGKYFKVMEHMSTGPESDKCKLVKMTVHLRDSQHFTPDCCKVVAFGIMFEVEKIINEEVLVKNSLENL
jgi:hypothetical protein